LAAVDNDRAVLNAFLAEHSLDGVELMLCGEYPPEFIPRKVIQGIHLSYWPTWLDFWLHNTAELRLQFGSPQQIADCYGSTNRHVLVDKYRADIARAVNLGAKYAVFHISHARKDEVYSYNFHYDDATVVQAAIELLNEVFDGFQPDIEILLENLWWPGLTLRDPRLVEKVLTEVNFDRTGLMLDTGHLMNTNLGLTTQEQGIAYVLETVDNLGSLKKYIRGIHLHYSLSGRYVYQKINESGAYRDDYATMTHILNIDQHLPFSNPAVQKIIANVQPAYLVSEFMFNNRDQWSAYLNTQNRALGL
jgi:hypothetical protein